VEVAVERQDLAHVGAAPAVDRLVVVARPRTVPVLPAIARTMSYCGPFVSWYSSTSTYWNRCSSDSRARPVSRSSFTRAAAGRRNRPCATRVSARRSAARRGPTSSSCASLADSRNVLGVEALVLHQRDARVQRPGRHRRLGHAQLAQRAAQRRLLVGASQIVNVGESPASCARARRSRTQNAWNVPTVRSSARFAPDQPADALAHLRRGLVRERHRQDVSGATPRCSR
jgi:hypothetical protein